MVNFLDLLFGKRKAVLKPEAKKPSSDPTEPDQIKIVYAPAGLIRAGQKLLKQRADEQTEKKNQ